MAKINIVTEGNFINIDADNADETKIVSWNSIWVSHKFIGTDLILENIGIPKTQTNPYTIPMADCQVEGAEVNTRATIRAAISKKIG